MKPAWTCSCRLLITLRVCSHAWPKQPRRAMKDLKLQAQAGLTQSMQPSTPNLSREA